ncbi:MAG: DUF1501 domain-containing protein [Pirellulales bacterium]
MTQWARREFLQHSIYSLLGCALNHGLAHGATAAQGSKIQSCILLMYYGGPSHLDTWDMKPESPSEIRGEFKPISTSVPGRFVCEYLPKTAQVVDKLAVIRSLHHPMTNHNAAMYEMLVGRTPSGGDNEILGASRTSDFPSYGSVLDYCLDKRIETSQQNPLTHVALPHVMHNVVDLPGQNAGFLGAQYDPYQLLEDPNQANFDVSELRLPTTISGKRLESRQNLLRVLNAKRMDAASDSMRKYRERAYQLLKNSAMADSFAVDQEPESVRDRYGRHRLGQSLLLARRLVEGGVKFINVNDKVYNGQLANWDSHADNFSRHKKDLLPPADQAFSALIEDLNQRNLLNSTLVVAMGEFGRSPKINKAAGRDHWPHCYSVVLAGGGVVGGATFGASDQSGAYPASDPVTPGDLAATIFWRFGLDHTRKIYDSLGRPYRLADGQPIRALF